MNASEESLFSSVLAGLERVTGPDPNGWHTALCPFHADRDRPNLRFNRLGFRCMACGEKGGLSKLAEKVGVTCRAQPFADRIDAIHEYPDEKDVLLTQVVRLRDPKEFRQGRPDGHGGWIWNIRGVRRVLYRLPQLLAADPDQYVFVVEGEKDADVLVALGMVATTNPGGAGKWRQEYSASLRGRKVVILPDNDEAGRAHAQAVAQSLVKEAHEVRIVELPDLPTHGDVSDWIAAGGTAEALLALSRATEPVSSAVDEEDDSSPPVSGGATAASRLVDSVLASEVTLFHDQRGDPYVAFLRGERRQVWPLRSQAVRVWLSHLAWTTDRTAPTAETVRTALGVLEGIARFDGTGHALEVRVAEHGDAIWYDLGDWRAVKTTAQGWEVVNMPPLLFRHFAHQKPQAEPARGGVLRELLRLLNLREARQQLLLLVYLVVALVPNIPRPILVVRGEHGSGKSTLLEFVRALLDPSHLTRQSTPDNLREFVQIASHNLCLFADNVSRLPDWMSDGFCRLCTGDGFSKRQLYTDDDDVIYVVRGLGGINGINNVATRPDLLDRALIFSLEGIPDRQRALESACREEFEVLRPALLGGLFDALSRAMAEVDTVHLDVMPRMADFAQWGCAAARALGYSDWDFLDAFGANVREQNESALENSPIAQAVLDLVTQLGGWEDTPAATLARLDEVAQGLRVDIRAKDWPKSPSALTRRLNEIRPNLAKEGIEVHTGHRTGPRRTIAFQPAENAVTAVIESENAVTGDHNAVIDDGVRMPSLDSDRATCDGNDGDDGILAGVRGDGAEQQEWEQEVP